ncbi:MAG: hypothetical protein KIT58_03365, partial [Planctomycetota bacterium]|nr:hypothetical protein [Planctomycetota bacterium]
MTIGMTMGGASSRLSEHLERRSDLNIVPPDVATPVGARRAAGGRRLSEWHRNLGRPVWAA